MLKSPALPFIYLSFSQMTDHDFEYFVNNLFNLKFIMFPLKNIHIIPVLSLPLLIAAPNKLSLAL